MRGRFLMRIMMALLGMLFAQQGMWGQTSYSISIKHSGTFTSVTSANAGDVLGDGGTISYQNGVLTLKGATIEGCIYSENDLTIKAVGDNFIIATDSFCIKNPKPEQDALINQTFPPVPAGQVVITIADEYSSLLMLPKVSYSSIGYFANASAPILSQTNGSSAKTALYATKVLGGGDGSQGSPYLIKSPRDLNNFSKYVNTFLFDTNGKTVRLEENIECSSLTAYEPIGYRKYELYMYDDPAFMGTFDGNNKTISNLTYNPNALIYINGNPEGIALFSYLSGTLKDLTLDHCTFGGGYNDGGITDFLTANGLIDHCTISNSTISNNDARIGGFVGYSEGRIQYCTLSNCTITGGYLMGGIVGSLMSDNISYCTVDGSSISNSAEAFIGGIAGFNLAGAISNCTVKSTSLSCGAGKDARIGAITPELSSNVSLTDNYYYGDVTVQIGNTVKSGHTQRGIGAVDNSGDYYNYDVSAGNGAKLYTKQLTFPAEDAYSSVAEVTGAYYDKIGSTTVTVAPGLMTQLAVTPKSGYVPSETSVTYTPTGGTQQTITPTKAADSYTYSFKMPDADATFALTYAKDLGSNSYSYQIASQDYTGSAVVLPTITMQDPTSVAAISLTQGTDYSIEGYKDSQKQAMNGTPVDAGAYYVTIKGKGNYAGSVDVAFTINQIDLSNVTIAAIGDQTYTGSAIEPAVTVTMNGANVNANEYTIGYSNNTNASTANSLAIVTLTSTGKNYTAATTKTATFNIVKAAATVSYATTSISKTFGDASFTNSLTNTGDGAVSYSSSNTSVATVNATTGEVTIVGNGSTTITATVTDGANYTYATKTATYTLSVGTAAMTVTATGYAGAYDGQAHGITVTAPDGATVKYGETAGTYNLDASPTYTNAGTYTVYYEVTKANYTTVTGNQTITISKAAGAISYATSSIGKTFGDAPFTNSLTNTGDGTVTYSSSNTAVATVNATTGEVTIVGNGSTTITATVTDGANYTYATKTATYTLSVGTTAMTVTATGYTGAYDGQAHGITVTAPDGATVKYGETAGAYNLDASPTYTNAGTYTVYYEVTKPNYTTVTGNQTVNISKAAGTINFASVSIGKTFGDAPFTNSLTNTGDGAVTYSSSNTAVATVNATTGEVTIVGNGSTTITATVTDGTNYTYATKTATYTLSVGTAAMTVTATGYTGAYDGQAHGITVTAPDGATVKYGETAGSYNLDASPTYTNAGTYTVYYQVTMTGFDTVTGSVAVTITKVDATVKYSNYEFTAKIGEPFNPPYLTLDPSDLVVTYYSSDTDVATVDAQTGEVTLVLPGKVNIYAEFAGDENYNSASDYYILTVLQRDIDPIDEDNTITMNDGDFLTTNDEGQQEEIRLDNTVIYDILYTLNIDGNPSESDGYDETEQCVVLNHSMTDNEINRIINGGSEPGSEEYADEYTGLTFKVPAGTGYVIIDSRTDGVYQMMVKIGNLAPVAFNHTSREKDSVFYECSTPTWVYIFNGGKVSNARMVADHRAKKTKSQVRIYSITRTSSNAAGIERVNIDALEPGRWYDLQGNRIERPMKKGLYILDGQKVVVR